MSTPDTNTRSPMSWLVYVPAVHSILLGHIFVLFCAAIGLVRGLHYRGPVLVGIHRKSRNYVTTIGHGMILNEYTSERTMEHELVHCDHYEDLAWLGMILGAFACIVSWRFGLILWATSGAPWLLPNYITATLRFKKRGVSWMSAAYRGASHERWAYEETE